MSETVFNTDISSAQALRTFNKDFCPSLGGLGASLALNRPKAVPQHMRKGEWFSSSEMGPDVKRIFL